MLQPNGERKEMDEFDEAPDYAPDPVDADADDRSGSFSVILGFRVNTLCRLRTWFRVCTVCTLYTLVKKIVRFV